MLLEYVSLRVRVRRDVPRIIELYPSPVQPKMSKLREEAQQELDAALTCLAAKKEREKRLMAIRAFVLREREFMVATVSGELVNIKWNELDGKSALLSRFLDSVQGDGIRLQLQRCVSSACMNLLSYGGTPARAVSLCAQWSPCGLSGFTPEGLGR